MRTRHLRFATQKMTLPNEFHVLREQHSILMEGLEAVEVSRTLYSKNILSTLCLESIESKKGRPKQVGKLLEHLRSSIDVKNAFSAFCDALSDIKALDWIAEHLRKELKKKEGSISTADETKDPTPSKEDKQNAQVANIIPLHFLGTSFLIPFRDALVQFETYLQVLLKSKEVNAEVRTVYNPDKLVEHSFMKIIEVICELRFSPALYEKMIFEFAEMKVKLSSALTKHEDVLPLMKDYVTTVSKLMPNHHNTSMEKINTTEDLLVATQDLWTSTGVDYIRKMIKAAGCPEAIQVLEDYLHLQVSFTQHTSNEVENISTETVDVSATLNTDSFTTEMYSKAKNNVCWTLCLPPSALLYNGISKGSIIIHWRLSASLVDYVKSISVNAIDICKNLLLCDGIQEIRVGSDFIVSCIDRDAAGITNGAQFQLNAHDKRKTSELIEACKRGDIQLVKSIIGAGISYNCIDENGLSPIDVAAAEPELRWELMDWLLSLGALSADGIYAKMRSLIEFCKTGDNSKVQEALQYGVDTNCIDSDGDTPLILAASRGRQEIVNMLLAKYADINKRGKKGSSALYLACKYGHKEVVDILLAGGADVNLITEEGASPLMIASQEGHYDIVQKLIRVPTIQLHAIALGFTALHFACSTGHAEIVKLLIDTGLDVNNHQPPREVTPLCVACEAGHAHVVKILIENKANLDLKLNTGESALHIAAYKGHCNIVMNLIIAGCNVNLQKDVGSTALYLASQKGHCLVVNALLAASCNVNLCIQDNSTPLIIASESGNINVVNLLIGANADINRQTKAGATALCCASSHGHGDIVDTLIAAKADVDLCSGYKFTPLYCASENGHENIVQTLIAAKANINAQNIEGCTPLHGASFTGHISTVQVLVAAKCNIDIQNHKQSTALMLASAQGYASIVEAIIGARANINLKDGSQCTALHHATTLERIAVVKLLCDAGADLNGQSDYTGFTPLHIACLKENLELVKILIAANANLNSQSSKNGWTALMPAASRGSIDIVLNLLTANADVNLEDNFGKTALEYAIMKQRSSVVQVLIQFGANINHQLQPQGWTPLMLAAQKGNLEITGLLCAQPDIQLQAKDNSDHTAMDIALSLGHNLVHDALVHITSIKGRNFVALVRETILLYEEHEKMLAEGDQSMIVQRKNAFNSCRVSSSNQHHNIQHIYQVQASQ